ncbi:MAG: hypothetical protein NVS9B11_17000 [Candidatus Dormibacteraceae bacterium]
MPLDRALGQKEFLCDVPVGQAQRDQTGHLGFPAAEHSRAIMGSKLLDRADLPQMRFHDLRHSCASLLLAQGGAPRVVTETRGHCCIAVTLDTYPHVLPAIQRELRKRWTELLARAGNRNQSPHL